MKDQLITEHLLSVFWSLLFMASLAKQLLSNLAVEVNSTKLTKKKNETLEHVGPNLVYDYVLQGIKLHSFRV